MSLFDLVFQVCCEGGGLPSDDPGNNCRYVWEELQVSAPKTSPKSGSTAVGCCSGRRPSLGGASSWPGWCGQPSRFRCARPWYMVLQVLTWISPLIYHRLLFSQLVNSPHRFVCADSVLLPSLLSTLQICISGAHRCACAPIYHLPSLQQERVL